MSKPLRKDRPDWARKRIEDAHQTAERGEGWLALSRAWNVTQAAALQWCRENVPAEICSKIGVNGMALCTRGRMRKEEFAKPKLVSASKPPMAPPRNTPRPVYVACHHILSTGERCCAPTENGKHVCPKCFELEKPLAAPRYYIVKSYI